MATTPSPSKTVAKNTAVLFAAQITVRLLGFIPVILLANHLGVDGYGLYNFALAFAMLFLPVCDLGIDTLIVREIAAEPSSRDRTGRHALGMKLILALFAFALIAGGAFIEGSHRERLDILLLAGAITVLRTFPMTLSAMFRAAQKMEIEAVLVVTQRMLEIAAALITVVAGYGISTLMILLVGAGVLSTTFALALAHRNGFPIRPTFSFAGASSLLRGGLPFALTGISVTLYVQIGTVILGYLLGEGAVGLYRSAYNLVFALSGFSAAIAVALYPAVAQQFGSNREEAVRLSARSLSTSLLLGLPVATGCTALAGPIIGLLYHAEFAQAATTLRLLAWWIPIMYTTTVLGHILAAIKRQNLLLAISVANAIVNIALNFLLIPIVGHDGAAIATVATESMGLVLLSAAVYRRFGRVYNLRGIAKIVAASLLMLPLHFLSGIMGVIPLITIGGLIYAAALFSMGAVTRHDIRRGLNVVFKRPSADKTGP